MPSARRKLRATAAAPAPESSPWLRLTAVAATLALFAAILLMPYFHGHWRLADDSYEYMLPVWRFQERVLQLGQWPHWNLNEGFGKPTAVSAGAMLFYPPVPLWGLIVGWSEQSYLGFIFLHLLAGACLAYRFSRRLGHALEASLFFALAYVGNGYVLGFFSNPALLFPYLFWPLLGEGLWELHADRDDHRAVAKIAAALVLIESGGYPLTKLLIYLSTALAALPLVRRHWRALGAAGAIAILCTAPEWASSLRALPLSERMGTDIYDDITYGSPTNFMALGTLLIPTAFLKRDGFQLGMVWLERSWWVGALTLALILAAYRQGALALGRFRRFAWIALGGMLFAFGGHSFFREMSSIAVPLLEHLRFANMGRMIPMIFLIFLGAASLDALQKSPAPGSSDRLKRRKRVSTLWALFLLVCTGVAVSQLDSGALSGGLYFDPATQWSLGALHTAFYLLLAYSAYTLRWSLTARLGWAATLVLIQFLSLADVGYAFRHLIAKELPTGAAIEEPFSPASPQPNVRSTRQWLDGNDWIRWDGNNKVFNAYTVPYHRWMRMAAGDARTGKFASSLASCQDNPAELGLQSPNGPPHSCAGTQFRIDRYYGNTIEISGSSERPAWIMVHDFDDPDWHAELNGADAPILPAFGVFKAVEVPAGQNWHLRFEYRHPWFPMLWWIAGLGFALLGAIAGIPKLREQLR